MSQILIFLLGADALWVCVGLARGKNMWRWIVRYWAILTVKNFYDLFKLMELIS